MAAAKSSELRQRTAGATETAASSVDSVPNAVYQHPMHEWDSLKGKACLVQYISAPLFVGVGIYLTLENISPFRPMPGPWESVLSLGPHAAHWLTICMLLAEGIGQALLAYSSWEGNCRAGKN
jgi:hypothetical protein